MVSPFPAYSGPLDNLLANVAPQRLLDLQETQSSLSRWKSLRKLQPFECTMSQLVR